MINIKKWMRRNINEYIDECNEINCTKLAEDCAEEFNLYEDDTDFTIPEWVFELATETAEWFGETWKE